jgi:hypothetical protein
MRKMTAIVLALVVGACAWVAYSKVKQHRRDAAYQAKIAPLKEALPNGMPMTAVSQYLNSQGITYSAVRYGGQNNLTYEVKVGEEPGDHLVCERWMVYAAIEFSADDKLTDVHLRKVGTCL